MDMLRFHLFTIGHAWTTDYGNPDKAEEFAWIFPYSPLHNVAVPEGGSQQYPAMILATGDHDDRCIVLAVVVGGSAGPVRLHCGVGVGSGGGGFEEQQLLVTAILHDQGTRMFVHTCGRCVLEASVSSGAC
jgi:prolyl oligopeptidase